MKKFICILFLIVGCEPYPNLDLTSRYVAKKIQGYNVVVHDSYENPICGGTVITSSFNETRVLTAGHCLTGKITELFYGYDGPMYISSNNGKLYPVYIEKYDYFNTDIGILTTGNKYDPIPIQEASEIVSHEPEEGTLIWLTGFPAGKEDAISFGIVSRIHVSDHYGRTMNQFDATVWYGNSGGGVFNHKGKLISVVSQIGPQYHGEPETGWFYGLLVKDIREAVKRK